MVRVTRIKLSRAQKRDLLAAYRSSTGEAYGLAYGPMEALTQTHHLATLTVRGQTNFTLGPWVTYQGYLGDWQSPITNGRIGRPYPINLALRP